MTLKKRVVNEDLSRTIIDLLNTIKDVIKEESSRNLTVAQGRVVVGQGKSNLAVIDVNSINLLGKYDVIGKITTTNREESTIDVAKAKRFLTNFSGKITQLNHIGVSYSCNSIPREIAQYHKLLEKSGFKLYEEPSGSKTRWLFIGDALNWETPLFEIVLIERKGQVTNKWTPHFQIDIDSTVSIEKLDIALQKEYGSGFDWKLNIKDYGTVLGMKILGAVNGTKICLGIGTNLRNTEYHRKNILKEVNQNHNKLLLIY